MTTVSNNISENSGTITGTTQDIAHVHLTENQSDLLIICSFSILALCILCVFSIIKVYITKSCLGCKKLNECKSEIKQIKKTLALNELVDHNAIKDIVKDIAEIKKRMLDNGTIHN